MLNECSNPVKLNLFVVREKRFWHLEVLQKFPGVRYPYYCYRLTLTQIYGVKPLPTFMLRTESALMSTDKLDADRLEC